MNRVLCDAEINASIGFEIFRTGNMCSE